MRKRFTFAAALSAVTAARSVVDPNHGFTTQLEILGDQLREERGIAEQKERADAAARPKRAAAAERGTPPKKKKEATMESSQEPRGTDAADDAAAGPMLLREDVVVVSDDDDATPLLAHAAPDSPPRDRAVVNLVTPPRNAASCGRADVSATPPRADVAWDVHQGRVEAAVMLTGGGRGVRREGPKRAAADELDERALQIQKVLRGFRVRRALQR